MERFFLRSLWQDLNSAGIEKDSADRALLTAWVRTGSCRAHGPPPLPHQPLPTFQVQPTNGPKTKFQL